MFDEETPGAGDDPGAQITGTLDKYFGQLATPGIQPDATATRQLDTATGGGRTIGAQRPRSSADAKALGGPAGALFDVGHYVSAHPIKAAGDVALAAGPGGVEAGLGKMADLFSAAAPAVSRAARAVGSIGAGPSAIIEDADLGAVGKPAPAYGQGAAGLGTMDPRTERATSTLADVLQQARGGSMNPMAGRPVPSGAGAMPLPSLMDVMTTRTP